MRSRSAQAKEQVRDRRLSIAFTANEYDELAGIAQEYDASMTWVVRRAIKAFLEQREGAKESAA